MRPTRRAPLAHLAVLPAFAVTLLCLCVPAAAAAVEPPGEGTLEGRDAEGRPAAFPLLRTELACEVAGPLARCSVVQRFGNPFPTPIEAIYLFPLPADAAVDRLEVQVGDRRIQGRILPREEAERRYDEARRAGVLASRLDQERPNLFTQSLANVLPGEIIDVELSFVSGIGLHEGAYELVLPLTAGPRYHPGAALPGSSGPGLSADTTRVPDASRVSPPFVAASRLRSEVSVHVVVDAGLPLGPVTSPSHAVDVAQTGEGTFEATLSPADSLPNRDFVLRWRPANGQPAAAVLAHRAETGGAFVLQLQPPVEATGARPARELVFVLDSSGSMRGWPLAIAKAVVRRSLAGLQPDDTFQLVNFSERSSSLAHAPLAATPANVERGLSHLERIASSGGTEMLSGIVAALSPPRDPRRMRIVVFLTDGYIGNEEEILAAVRQRLGDARLFAVGVGSSVNRYLLDELALEGRGAVDYVGLSLAEPGAVAERFQRRIARPVLTDLELDTGGADVSDLLPRRLPDLFDGQPVTVLGRYGRGGRATFVLRGRLAGAPWEQRVDVDLPDAEPRFSAITTAWARARVAELERHQRTDASPEPTAEITRLGLRHRIVTRMTSFLAVDEAPRTVVPADTVVQPLAVPQGMDVGRMGGGAGLLGLKGKGIGGGGYGAGLSGSAVGDAHGAGGLGVGDLTTKGSGGGYGTGRGGLAQKGGAVATGGSEAVVTGSLDRELVRRVIKAHRSQVQYCYERVSVSRPLPEGRVTLRFVIAANGSVREATVASTTLGDREVEDCLVARVKTWEFPRPKGGGEVTVSYPFTFTPGG